MGEMRCFQLLALIALFVESFALKPACPKGSTAVGTLEGGKAGCKCGLFSLPCAEMESSGITASVRSPHRTAVS